jgi:hypothetical protein
MGHATPKPAAHVHSPFKQSGAYVLLQQPSQMGGSAVHDVPSLEASAEFKLEPPVELQAASKGDRRVATSSVRILRCPRNTYAFVFS